MQSLESFEVNSETLCGMIPLVVPTFFTLRSRDGLLQPTHPLRSQERGGAWTLADAFRTSLAMILKNEGYASAEACKVASSADPLGAHMRGHPIRFGLIGGRLTNHFGPDDLTLTVPFQREAERLICLFVGALVLTRGGRVAQAALSDFDSRVRAIRKGTADVEGVPV